MHFASYEDAEVWILNHQLGRRNLLNPTAIRKVRGELYNRLKASHGGDRKSEKSKCQIDTLIGDAATQVTERAGVSSATVKRDGARVETLESLTKAARNVAENASDKDVKSLAMLSPSDQDAVARVVREGKATTIRDAIKLIGAKPGKGTDAQETDHWRCPNCAGTGWTEDEFGVICAKCNHPHGEPADPFDEDPDPFGEGWEGDDRRTDSDGTDSEEQPPGRRGAARTSRGGLKHARRLRNTGFRRRKPSKPPRP